MNATERRELAAKKKPMKTTATAGADGGATVVLDSDSQGKGKLSPPPGDIYRRSLHR